MNDFEQIQNKKNIFQYLKIGSVAGVVSVIAAIAVNAFDIGSSLYSRGEKNGAESAIVATELDNLANRTALLERDNNQTTKNIRAIEKLEQSFRNLEKSSSAGNAQRIIMQNAMIVDRMDKLEKRLTNLPSSSSGGISKEVLNTTVKAAVQNAENRFKRDIEAIVNTMIESRISNLSTASGDGIPIATKRRIHYVEKDCVHLPSMGKQFTLKFKNRTEFCWKPSVLWFDITFMNRDYFNYRHLGKSSNSCSIGNTCYIGFEEDGTRYKVRIENTYEKEDIRYHEVNFQKIG